MSATRWIRFKRGKRAHAAGRYLGQACTACRQFYAPEMAMPAPSNVPRCQLCVVLTQPAPASEKGDEK